MTQSVRDSIYQAISSIRLIDPHTHINPHHPASSTLADILGYHYYTELIHSAGMPREEIEEAGLPPRELVKRLVHGLPNIENTANYQWLISICRTFFGFEDSRIDHSNWESLYDAAEARMNSAEWPQMVLDQSNVEAVFLTNDFDDQLQGFDTDRYIPCLRTDDLVFHLTKRETRQRLEGCTGIELDGSLHSLRASLEQRFQYFVRSGARACAISIPPSFEPLPVSDGRATTALDEVLRRGSDADESHQTALSRRVFWTLAELCDQYRLPFDLMIGVNRGVYGGGVYQGHDLYDSRVSLIQYRELFNTFTDVKFPISVLASVTNQELVSYAWIFPNVITNGHWWYSNTPSFIARDAAARLEAVPRNNQIGYYSDAYKLEFVWPKFDMYRQILAAILADHFVGFCGWSEEQAIELGRQVLRDNVDETFPPPQDPGATTPIEDTFVDDAVAGPPDTSVAGTAALAAEAIGIVEVQDQPELEETVDLEQMDFEHSREPIEETVDIAQPPQAESLRETVEEIEEVIADDAEVEQEPAVDQLDDDDDADAELDYMEESRDETEELYAEDTGSVESGDEYDTVDEQLLPELPTVVELHDTVRIDEEASPEQEITTEYVGPMSHVDATAETVEIDSLPTNDEIQELDLPDVELTEDQPSVAEAADIEAEADSSPLYVGDILNDSDDDVNVLEETIGEPSTDDEEIRMLRGEASFTPDEDSMQLTRDPLTGELTFPIQESAEPGYAEPDETAEVDFAGAEETAEEEYLIPAESADVSDIEVVDEAEIDYVEEEDAEIDYVEEAYEDEGDAAAEEDGGVVRNLEDTLDWDDEDEKGDSVG